MAKHAGLGYAEGMAEVTRAILDYEAFLEEALRRYWQSRGSSRENFLALLLETPEARRVAWADATRDGLGKPVLAGAASVATVATLLRVLASGPLGLLLTGVSVGTLLAVYGREQSSIRRKAVAVRGLVQRYRGEFEELDRERSTRPMRDAQWNTMMDGLVQRFLSDLDGTADAAHDPASVAGFSEHVVAPSGVAPRPGKTSP